MDRKKIRVGIVGVGRQAQDFMEIYHNHPSVELIAACDVSQQRLFEAAQKYGIQQLYGDFSICESDVDMISIHTPDHLHTEYFIRALEHGKHVFVEKPMADNEADLLRMVEAARTYSSSKTMVGHILRFNPLFRATKTMIDAGILGQLFYLEGDYIHDLRYQQDQVDPDTGTNWYLQQEHPMIGGGIHPFDILRWYTGSDPIEVQSYANHIAFPEMANPDSIVSIFKFANGAMAKVTALYASIGPLGEEYHVAAYGTKGTVNRRKISLSGMHEFMELPFKTEGHPYNPEVDHFIDCILDDKPTSCDAIDGAKSTMAVLKAIEAIGTGRAVAIPRL